MEFDVVILCKFFEMSCDMFGWCFELSCEFYVVAFDEFFRVMMC